MKTAVSIPDDVFRSAEKLSKRLGIPRSKLYAEAVARYVRERADEAITEALDKVYGDDPALSALPKPVAAMQFYSLKKNR